MVTLLLGPYGHGKSTHIIDQIRIDYEQGVRSFLIVPEQQTLSCERTLAEELPPQAQLFTEATNFTRLANTVFRMVGGLKYNYVTKGGQNLIMYRSICELREALNRYKIPKGREKAFVKLFLQAIGELKSYSVSPSQLESALDDIESDALKERIEDILKIWAHYDGSLADMYDDPYDDLRMLEEKLSEWGYLTSSNFYIDSFYGFTKSQLNIVKRIIESAPNVTIALDCPHDVDDTALQYKKILKTKNTVLAICKSLNKEYEIVPFKDNKKHKSPELAYLSENIWNFHAKPIVSKKKVSLAVASDEFEECEYVCAKIKKLILKGSKYGSIAIIARNSSTYQGIIDFCLKKYGIPYYFSVPSRLDSKPAIKMVLSALNFLSGMRSEDIIAYAKCGYTDIEPSELHMLESYIYKWNIYGKKFKSEDYWNANPNGFVLNASDSEKKELEIIQIAKDKLLSHISILEKPFLEEKSVRDCAAAVYSFLSSHSMQEKLLDEIANETSDAEKQELSQVWGALIDALNLVTKICGNIVCDPATFTSLLTYAMMDTKIGTIPTGEDNVIIADASLVRAKNIEHVFVLGANVGVFPATINDVSFFNDRDKTELETANIDLSSKTDERGDDELLFFKNSISAASTTLTVTSLSSSISGAKMDESIGFSRIKKLLPKLVVADISKQRIIDRIHTKEMAKELYSVADPVARSAILECTKEAFPSVCFHNSNDAISSEAAKEVFKDKLYLSKSKLESFAKCRFNYYCSYVLKLRDSEKFSFSDNDIGTLVHSIFEHFLKLHNSEKRTYSDDEILEIVTKLTDEYTLQACGVRALSNKMKHFFSRLKSTVCVFVRSLLEEMEANKFTPEYFELSINGNGYSAPLPTKFPVTDDCSIVMTGIADRVDVCRENDTAYVKIYDYKTGSHKFSGDKLDKGLDLQMLIYLLALCSMEESHFKKDVMKWAKKIEPAGIVYLTYKINKTDEKHEVDLSSVLAAEHEAAAIGSKITRSGLELNEPSIMPSDEKYALDKKSYIDFAKFDELFKLVKSTIASIGLDMLSGDAKAEPMAGETPCDYCKNGAICRRRKKSVRAH